LSRDGRQRHFIIYVGVRVRTPNSSLLPLKSVEFKQIATKKILKLSKLVNLLLENLWQHDITFLKIITIDKGVCYRFKKS